MAKVESVGEKTIEHDEVPAEAGNGQPLPVRPARASSMVRVQAMPIGTST